MNDFCLNDSRYIKFSWLDPSKIPKIGTTDYQPKFQAFRFYEAGTFLSRKQFVFCRDKNRIKLPSLNMCAYCQSDNVVLTSEHLIPEFLGAGIELKNASCSDCQSSTMKFESVVSDSIFGAIRKNLSLKGKKGAMKKSKFEADFGLSTSDNRSINIATHPTILTMPKLHPATSFSRRTRQINPVFQMVFHNLNVDPNAVELPEGNHINSATIDTVSFCQLIAKIAHVSVVAWLRRKPKNMFVADLIRMSLSREATYDKHFDHVGHISSKGHDPSPNLHEVDVGEISWNGKTMFGARVRLFACFGMPIYHVAVGQD